MPYNLSRMHRSYFLLLSFLFVCCLSACNKDGLDKPQHLITGKWNLQRQNVVQYIDGVKKVDTAYLASANSVSYVNFNSNGAFNSVSHYFLASGATGGLDGGGVNIAAEDTTSGTYNYDGSVFSISSTVAGFGNAQAVFGYSVDGGASVVKLVSHDASVVQLTASNLTLHIQFVYMVSTSATESKTYKSDDDFYYTR